MNLFEIRKVCFSGASVEEVREQCAADSRSLQPDELKEVKRLLARWVVYLRDSLAAGEKAESLSGPDLAALLEVARAALDGVCGLLPGKDPDHYRKFVPADNCSEEEFAREMGLPLPLPLRAKRFLDTRNKPRYAGGSRSVLENELAGNTPLELVLL